MDATERFEERKTAIHLLRSGSAPADVASQLDRSLAWVYKWRTRFNETEDFQSLRERSRAPRSCPRRLDEGRCQAIKRARSELEAQAAAAKGLAYIGAQAVQARLRQQGLVRLPSTASIERVLRRAGMTRPRQRPAKTVDYPRMRPQVPHGLCQVDIVPHCLKAGPKLWCFNAIAVVSGYASGQSYLHKRAADPRLSLERAGYRTLHPNRQRSLFLWWFHAPLRPRPSAPLVFVCRDRVGLFAPLPS